MEHRWVLYLLEPKSLGWGCILWCRVGLPTVGTELFGTGMSSVDRWWGFTCFHKAS